MCLNAVVYYFEFLPRVSWRRWQIDILWNIVVADHFVVSGLHARNDIFRRINLFIRWWWCALIVLKIVWKHRGSAHVAEESRDLRIYRVSRCVSTERPFFPERGMTTGKSSNSTCTAHFVYYYLIILKYILLL